MIRYKRLCSLWERQRRAKRAKEAAAQAAYDAYWAAVERDR